MRSSAVWSSASYFSSESRQAKKREADKLFGTTKLIVSVIFEPLNNLKRAAGEVPESYEQTATSRGAILGDNLRPLRSLVEALEKYREAVLSLKPFVENDQTLDRGSPAVLELTRHMRKLEALNLRTFKGGVLITSSAERLRLTQTVVPDVLAGAGRLINALLPDRQESDDE